MNIFKEFEKMNIYSASLHRVLYQKVINCFINYKPINKRANTLNTKVNDLVIKEIVNDKHFEKSDFELET